MISLSVNTKLSKRILIIFESQGRQKFQFHSKLQSIPRNKSWANFCFKLIFFFRKSSEVILGCLDRVMFYDLFLLIPFMLPSLKISMLVQRLNRRMGKPKNYFLIFAFILVITLFSYITLIREMSFKGILMVLKGFILTSI